MNSEATALDKVLAIWKDESQLKTIKEIYAPNLTNGEFQTFVQMGMATGLNPFLREIWAVKYDKSAPAQIFIGRDGYRKTISRNKNYDYHFADAVYSNDEFCFDLTKGEVRHTYNFKDRGKLMGAYCLVFMKTSSKPFYVFVELSEYDLGRSLWKDKKATMIKKVAECQAIRMADSCTFGGTHSDDEFPEDRREERKLSKLNKLTNTIEGEVVEPEPTEIIDTETGEVTQSEEVPADPNAPSFDEVKKQMENAQNIEALILAKDLARSLKFSPVQIDELAKLFKQQQVKLKA